MPSPKQARMLPSAFRQKFLSTPGLLLSPIWIRPVSVDLGFQAGFFARAAAAAFCCSSWLPVNGASSSSSLLAAGLFTALKHALAITASINIHRPFDFMYSPLVCLFHRLKLVTVIPQTPSSEKGYSELPAIRPAPPAICTK